jgi:hypothetical protein
MNQPRLDHERFAAHRELESLPGAPFRFFLRKGWEVSTLNE